ncbi:MAG: GTP-binding protein [Erysipelotrichaceae bacterium]|nr:GTP-binding protein [Erysipelotrichaceae bacterium]
MSKKTIPITLLTGYLGSGKTTLINHILTNQSKYKIAIIVNDIGEVNIDATLIEQGGVVTKKDDSLVALSNGCICCNLKMDLVGQIIDIINQEKFDYIVIEASGICEPLPIAQTITMMPEMIEGENKEDICRLDSVVTVVDALRLRDEFNCGNCLKKENLEEEDIEKLIIEQLEFCNIIILNKVSDISKEELEEVKAVIRSIQPQAKIIETDYAKVNINEILNTNLFDLEASTMTAGWIEALEHPDEKEASNEVLEYGISTFVYYRRAPFNRKMFYEWLDTKWDKSIIRSKGVVYFTDEMDTAYMVESAGNSKNLVSTGPWVSAMPEEEQQMILIENPDIKDNWDEEYQDRMNKIVFIGKNMDKEAIITKLDSFLDL